MMMTMQAAAADSRALSDSARDMHGLPRADAAAEAQSSLDTQLALKHPSRRSAAHPQEGPKPQPSSARAAAKEVLLQARRCRGCLTEERALPASKCKPLHCQHGV